MKKLLLSCLLFILLNNTTSAQKCKVFVEALSLTYEGECKSDKANGKGKATGQDSYEGEFKAGYPEGLGKYTWKLGDWFEGTWKKGYREGKGEMHYKTQSGGDSVIAGFWKKDLYLGKYEIPYKVISQTSKISTVKVNRNSGYKEHDITINIESTSGGPNNIAGNSGGQMSDAEKPKLTSADVQKGNFGSQSDMDNSAKSTKSILKMVEFPFKVSLRISDTHVVEIEFFEEGNYTVDISILN